MNRPKILAVDGAESRKEIIEGYLSKAGFDVVSVPDGDSALKILDERNDISVVISDRVLSKKPFMSFLKAMKDDTKNKHIPVIVQTSSPKEYHIMECIDAGAQYYLVHPCAEDVFVSVVKSAHKDTMTYLKLRDEAQKKKHIPKLIKKANFILSTLKEARSLGFFLGYSFDDPEEAARSLITYLSNAVYANLGIYAREKLEFLSEGTLEKEIARRQGRGDFSARNVCVEIDSNRDLTVIRIVDEGAGFDWKKDTKLIGTLSQNTLGRGSQTGITYFDNIEYTGRGNEVTCIKYKTNKE